MSDIYVILGNRQLKDRIEEGTEDEGYVALIVNNKALDDTYQGFLEECCGTLAQNNIQPEQRPTYLAAREAAFDNDENVTHKILVYDRSTSQGQAFDLEDKVGDTAGEFLYVAQQSIGNQQKELQTLEMYILADGSGGK